MPTLGLIIFHEISQIGLYGNTKAINQNSTRLSFFSTILISYHLVCMILRITLLPQQFTIKHAHYYGDANCVY